MCVATGGPSRPWPHWHGRWSTSWPLVSDTGSAQRAGRRINRDPVAQLAVARPPRSAEWTVLAVRRLSANGRLARVGATARRRPPSLGRRGALSSPPTPRLLLRQGIRQPASDAVAGKLGADALPRMEHTLDPIERLQGGAGSQGEQAPSSTRWRQPLLLGWPLPSRQTPGHECRNPRGAERSRQCPELVALGSVSGTSASTDR